MSHAGGVTGAKARQQGVRPAEQKTLCQGERREGRGQFLAPKSLVLERARGHLLSHLSAKTLHWACGHLC